ncbi:proprotein convertase subtilisin/kexin type 6 isoform X1 [Peromyscus californicus insignis]|uniref:proprotein convertase subtilisin/kexin type 6 isoform X1 n=1 Tax=Peromyscus californicus insignis TaxID=564181 RepID=UPI0022A7D829|nr:proprotein convertase subtilisin/kexin type 6 isoform X1 [Peromyscus californicus insignis]
MPPRAPPAPGPRPPPRAADVARGSGAAGRHGLPPLALRPWRWLLLLALPAACSAPPPPPRPVYTNHWAVQVLGGPGAADRVAAAHGYLNLGQIGNLDDYYHFYHSKTFKRSTLSSRGPHTFLRMDPQVKWFQQQEVKRRVKRQARGDSLYFNDPIWSNMWYMHCADKNSRCRSEMNVQAAWKRGYTGKNVVVTILDDGIERNHPDLAPNYDSYASYDVNGNDYDPSPRYDASNENKHGTRCAGEVAASANNSYCIVGIAYNAKIGGIRMLDGDVTDVVEAKSLGIRPNYIDIYSASWGPDDDGKTVDGPGRLAKQAFEYGIKKGRQGLGSIFVWASGNGGREGDHCSCDGYTNSIYTISVSSTTENGHKPWYLEECASTLATTYSSGAFYERKIVTTDLRQRCTDGHTGTSVSAPMVAGIIALALEANNQLTWRDVQHLLVKTSRPAHLKASDWKVNGAGHKVSHLYGFGLVDAEALVLEARKWTAVPSQHVCVATADKRPRSIPIVQVLRTTALTNACADHSDQRVVYLEHVVVRISISHPRRGDLQIHLISPSGTKSQLLAKRLLDFSNEGFTNWEFMTVHCWGEKAEGEWTLEIQDIPSQVRNPEKQGKLKEWSLILYGTAEHPYRTFSSHQSRSRMLELSVPELEPLKVAGPPPQAETPEDEEEYTAPSTQGSSNTLQTSVCHPECGDKGCDGPNADQCLNCVHFSLGNAKTSRKCVSECPLGYFGDTAARRCRRCHKGCETCTGRSPTQCLSCRRGFYHHQETNTCVTLCPVGFYADESQRHCLKCHPSCQTCVDEPEKCTMCKEGFSLARGSCIPDCEPGTYFDSELIRCGECHHTCRTCVGPSREECIHCAKSFHFQDWKCVPACGEGFYPEEMPGLPHKVCRRCDENCLSCEGSSRNCSRCKAGFAQLGTSCITNHTCSNADETFCEMVKSNRLCERKLFIQFCCRTCLLAG